MRLQIIAHFHVFLSLFKNWQKSCSVKPSETRAYQADSRVKPGTAEYVFQPR